MRHTLKGTAAMSAFASTVARSLKGGEILLLQGELGSGKTTFVKALARALGIKKTVVSPTFTLCHEYTITPTLALPLHGRGRKPDTSYTSRRVPPEAGFLPSSAKGGDKEGGRLLHLDCYRLKTSEEFLHLGALEHIGNPNTITVIEWPELIKKFLPRAKRIVIVFAYGKTEKERIVKIQKK